MALLHIYTDSDNEMASPLEESFNSDAFLRKIGLLEEQNSHLKLEVRSLSEVSVATWTAPFFDLFFLLQVSHLRCLTQELEEKEQQLVHQCVRQLDEANRRVNLDRDC